MYCSLSTYFFLMVLRTDCAFRETIVVLAAEAQTWRLPMLILIIGFLTFLAMGFLGPEAWAQKKSSQSCDRATRDLFKAANTGKHIDKGMLTVRGQSNPTGTKGLTAPPSALSQPGLLGGSSTGSGGTTGGMTKQPTTTRVR